jgi:acetoacetyl-CoA synthetase
MRTDIAPLAPIWVPSEARQAQSRLRKYLDRVGIETYEEAWNWSVGPETAGAFWSSVAEEFQLGWRRAPSASLERDPTLVTGARWFRDGRLNYAERALKTPPAGPESTAILARSQTRPGSDLTWAQLSTLVARIRAGLVASGIGEGDRVAAYLPNIPETLAAFLATASLGAVWTCCAPEMGVAGVLDRLGQVDPTVLISIDGYIYGEREVERHGEAEAIRAGLTSVSSAVWVPYLRAGGKVPSGWIGWEEFTAVDGPLEFAAVGFDHPLYILFSSGTTGKPKAIIHGHGGILLEHAKALGWHFDLGPGDRFFWYTTTGWMMWNFCISGLVVGSTVVVFDGDPAWPRIDGLWALMAETSTTCGGVGAGYLVACAKAPVHPSADHDLSALKTLGSTGSPLPTSAAEWVYSDVAPDLMLSSFSGGTDVCTGFVGSSPLHSVWAGEISCRCLGARVEVFDPAGQPLVEVEGELVLTAPLPSMPVGFWRDDNGTRFRAAYFDRFPHVWAHGDRAKLTDRGTVIITGRSDGTLNRGGVRMGTAEFYSVVEALDEVADSLVVHLEDRLGGPGELWLFLVEAPQADPDDAAKRVRDALRRDLSPRHVPDRIVSIPVVPRTLSGKKLEVPVKRILSGEEPSEALSLSSLANPDSLEPFIQLARQIANPTKES